MNIEEIVRQKKIENLISNGGLKLMDINVKSLLNEEQRKRKQKILDDIKAIEKSFQMSAPAEKQDYNPSYTKVDLKDTSEDKINKKATDNLRYFKAKGEADINDNYNAQKDKIDASIASEKQKASAKADVIVENAGEQRVKAKNSAINRGIVHSSIYDNMMTGIERQEMSDLQDLKAEAESSISSLNDKIDKLDKEKQNALELFNISYAVKLQDEIDGMKKEIETYNEKAKKYNEDIEEKNKALISKYDEKYQKQVKQAEERNQRILSFLQKYGYGTVSNKLKLQQTEVAKDYLNTLDKATALELLTEDDKFKDALGINYFNDLVDYVKNRRE